MFVTAWLALDDLSVSEQPRKVFTGIHLLADDIASNGLLINPLTVAAFSRTSFAEYLRQVNELWGTQHQVHQHRPAADGLYYVLIAGERRLRALRWLWKYGCSECNPPSPARGGAGNCFSAGENDAPKKVPALFAGQCFMRHLGTDKAEARVSTTITVRQALYLQLAENTHRRPSPDEEAMSYAVYFRALEMHEPGITVSAFARRVGRSAETVRRALRYNGLPEQVRTAVSQGRVAYGIALEYGKLLDVDITPVELEHLWRRTIEEPWTVHAYAKMIKEAIRARDPRQTTMGNIFGSPEKPEELEQHKKNLQSERKRKGVERYASGMRDALRYFDHVGDLVERKLIGVDHAPYSDNGTLRGLSRLAQHATKVQEQLDPPKAALRKRERKLPKAAAGLRRLADAADGEG
jgi:ParB-like chromosome segregation protein Spo0J